MVTRGEDDTMNATTIGGGWRAAGVSMLRTVRECRAEEARNGWRNDLMAERNRATLARHLHLAKTCFCPTYRRLVK